MGATMVFSERSEQAKTICASQWQGRRYTKIDYCDKCPLYIECIKESVVHGIGQYNTWIDGINKKAEKL